MIDFDLTNLSEREKNTLMVLDYVAEYGPTSAIDTAKKTGLSTATVSRVLGVLKSKNIIIESTKGYADMGRPPIMISINPEYGFFLHFYLSHGTLNGYLSDFSGKQIYVERMPVVNTMQIDEFVKKLHECAEGICSKKSIPYSRIIAAGISVPGLVDEKNSIVKDIPNFVNFNNKDMTGLSEKELGIPVIVNNTARLCAVGEHITNFRTEKNLVYLDFTRSSGIGAGIIINGVLHTGINGIAGEIGNMLVDARSYSGRYIEGEGCLEALAGFGVMIDRVEHMLGRGHAKILKAILDEDGADRPDLKHLERAVKGQDLDVQDVFDDTMKLWGMAAFNLALVVDPDVIILGGVVNKDNDVVLSRIKHFFDKTYSSSIDIRLGGDHSQAQYKGGVHQLKKYAMNHLL